MNFLRISDAKIKIVLSSSEMDEYGISASDEGCNAANRRAVWEILEMAKREVGFDPEGDKILVQFYPIKSGGCEIFVTKLGILSTGSSRLVLRSERVGVIAKDSSFYLFSSISDVRRAIRAVLAEIGERRATLFFGDGTYVLEIAEITDGRGLGELAPFCEFSTPVSDEVSIYVAEHFDALYRDVPIKALSDIS